MLARTIDLTLISASSLEQARLQVEQEYQIRVEARDGAVALVTLKGNADREGVREGFLEFLNLALDYECQARIGDDQ